MGPVGPKGPGGPWVDAPGNGVPNFIADGGICPNMFVGGGLFKRSGMGLDIPLPMGTMGGPLPPCISVGRFLSPGATPWLGIPPCEPCGEFLENGVMGRVVDLLSEFKGELANGSCLHPGSIIYL